jgi:hypothetical protein
LYEEAPRGDTPIVMGDFNARVGCATSETAAVVGRYGDERTNYNGGRLVNFAMETGLAVMGTFFRHKPLHKMTHWPPGALGSGAKAWGSGPRPLLSKQGRMIDHILLPMDLRLRNIVQDVRVYNGAAVTLAAVAGGSTDHALLGMRLGGARVMGCRAAAQRQSQRPPRRAPGLIVNRAKLQDSRTVQEYEKRRGAARAVLSEQLPLQARYQQYVRGMVQDFSECFGSTVQERRKAWVSEAAATHIAAKKRLYRQLKMMAPDHPDTVRVQREYTATCTNVKRHVRQDKRIYLQGLIDDLEEEDRPCGLSRVYQAIQQLSERSSRHRLEDQPIKTADGQYVEGDLQARTQAMAEYFKGQFNIPCTATAEVSAATMPDLPPQPASVDDDVRGELFGPMSWTAEDVEAALRSVANGKAADQLGVIAEMLKVGQWDVELDLIALFREMVDGGEVPTSWQESVVVPLYKCKGDAADCDNYRAITIMDIVLKVFTKLVYRRLLKEVEAKMHEAQAGFRRGRSITDCIFTMRQMMEGCWEYDRDLYVCFVDLRKAYDCLPRGRVWAVLRRYGVSEWLVRIIAMLYRSTTAMVRIGPAQSEPFEISSGVKQGCPLSPLIFNIYLDFVMRRVLERCEGVGTRRDACGLGVIGVKWSTTASSETRSPFARSQQNPQGRPEDRATWRLMALLYADDSAIVATSLEALQIMMTIVEEEVLQWGLTISWKKTKVAIQSRTVVACGTKVVVTLSGRRVGVVRSFVYLGTTLDFAHHQHGVGPSTTAIQRRMRATQTRFRGMRHTIWRDRMLTLKIKIGLFKTLILPVLLHGSETWNPQAVDLRRLEGFQGRCLQTIMGLTWHARVSYEQLRQRAQLPALEVRIRCNRLRYFGHVMRMPADRYPALVLCGLPAGARQRPPGRPRPRWFDLVLADLRALNLSTEIEDIRQVVGNRREWAAKIREGTGERRRRPEREQEQHGEAMEQEEAAAIARARSRILLLDMEAQIMAPAATRVTYLVDRAVEIDRDEDVGAVALLTLAQSRGEEQEREEQDTGTSRQEESEEEDDDVLFNYHPERRSASEQDEEEEPGQLIMGTGPRLDITDHHIWYRYT